MAWDCQYRATEMVGLQILVMAPTEIGTRLLAKKQRMLCNVCLCSGIFNIRPLPSVSREASYSMQDAAFSIYRLKADPTA